MSLKSYQSKYTVVAASIELVSDPERWKTERGFIPRKPYYETNSNSLAIPLYNEENQLIAVQFRRLDANINDSDRYFLNKRIKNILVKTDKLDREGPRILCEGTLDTIVLREVYELNAWCVLGLKKYRLRQLSDYTTPQDLIIFDNDQAGIEAREYIKSIGLTGVYIPFNFKDICEFYTSSKTECNRFFLQLRSSIHVPT